MKSKAFEVKDWERYSFKYPCDVEYDSVSHCSEAGCCQGDYTRCTTLENLRVTKAPSTRFIIHSLFGNRVKDEILQYCLDRILKLEGADDPNNFTAHASHGYYGEELGDVSFNRRNQVTKKIGDLLFLKTDTARIEFILIEEYSKLLPKMNGLKYSSMEVNTERVKIPNREYLIKIDKERIEQYKVSLNKEYPICVCIKEGDFYTLLDGYHRFSAWESLGHKKTKIIMGEK